MEERVEFLTRLSLEELISKVDAYMKNHNYNMSDYEASGIGHNICECKVVNGKTKKREYIDCCCFALREYNNPKHHIFINIPYEKEKSEIDIESISNETIVE